MFLPYSLAKIQYCWEPPWPRGSELGSDRQGSNFVSCVWRAVSSHLSHHPQDVLLAKFILFILFHLPSIPHQVDKRSVILLWSIVSKAADRSNRVSAVTLSWSIFKNNSENDLISVKAGIEGNCVLLRILFVNEKFGAHAVGKLLFL